MPESIFASGLGPGPANFSPLTPLRFLSRSAAIYPERTAIIHGPRRISYREFDTRSRRLASALARGAASARGDTVAVDGAERAGDARGALRRADARRRAQRAQLPAGRPYHRFILEHGEAKVLITDREFSDDVGGRSRCSGAASRSSTRRSALRGPGERLGEIEYEALLAEGEPDFDWRGPATSGRRSASSTRRAPRATRRASCITIAART